MDDYLAHYGIKNMKWGVRRYQNSDGTLTDAGKRRYARDAREKEYDKYDEGSGKYYKQSKKGRSDLAVDADRYVKEDIQRTKRLTEESGNLTRNMKNLNDTTMRNRKVPKMDLSNMSDKEMRDAINRAYLEKQYDEMFNPKREAKGREYASKILETTGTVLGVAGSALGIALAIRDLRTPK